MVLQVLQWQKNGSCKSDPGSDEETQDKLRTCRFCCCSDNSSGKPHTDFILVFSRLSSDFPLHALSVANMVSPWKRPAERRALLRHAHCSMPLPVSWMWVQVRSYSL